MRNIQFMSSWIKFSSAAPEFEHKFYTISEILKLFF